ncbi:MAG: cell division rane protein, partial [Pseudomonadota bacterium]
MDIIIYLGLALAVAAALFIAFVKSRTGAAPAPVEADGGTKPVAEITNTSRVNLASLGTALEPDAAPTAHEDQPVIGTLATQPTADSALSNEAALSSHDAAPSSQLEQRVPSPLGADTPSAKRNLPGLRLGLTLSRDATGFFGRLKALLSGKGEISPEIVDGIEEVLLSSDVGVATTSVLLDRLRADLSKGQLRDEAAVWDALRQQALQMLEFNGAQTGLKLGAKPTVVLLVGVNGAGKTTTIGKLATHLRSQGLSCVLAAGDTFRAAAVQQLVVWGQRVGCEVVKGKDGADPGSVIFDAVKRAEELGADVVLADTAGRLHTKSNLMAEMQKIARTAGKALDGAPHEVLLVIDSTNGQNALAQAREFKESLGLTGIVLTKLDGTAKGGVVLGISDNLKLPVRFIGLGERPDDLHEFVPSDFVEALLG